jgi:N6-L-threonylcarbamoyladenine synthase
LVGKAFAATLGEHYQKPIIKVNHIHGHILSFLLERKQSDIQFPIIVLSVSG